MAGRRLNPRLVKIHYSYTAGELASLLGLHKNTISHWRRVFEPPSTCKTVEGTVSPDGWCKIYVKK
jgi:hypothetical protein